MQRISIQIALLGVATFVSLASQATAYAGSSEQPMTIQKASVLSTVLPKAWATPVATPALRSLSLLAFLVDDSCTFNDKTEDAKEKAAKKVCQDNKEAATKACDSKTGTAKDTCKKTAEDNYKACWNDKAEDALEKLSKKCDK